MRHHCLGGHASACSHLQGCLQGPEALAGPGSVLGTWPVLMERDTPFQLQALSVVLAYGIPRSVIQVCAVDTPKFG